MMIDEQIAEIGQLSTRNVVSVELQNKNCTIVLTQRKPTEIGKFDVRFHFKLDSQAPLAVFLPAAAKMPYETPLPFNEDLTKVAEIGLGESMAKETGKQEA